MGDLRLYVWRGIVAGAGGEAPGPIVHLASAGPSVAETTEVKTPAPVTPPLYTCQRKGTLPWSTGRFSTLGG